MFHIASEQDVKRGKTTDIYFSRAKEVLRKKGIDKKVVAECTASSLPLNYKWGIFSGVEELAYLFEGYNVDIYTLPEGSVFYPMEPVVRIEGMYTEFCELETPLLGLICQPSGISTKSARLKKLAGNKIVLSFGVRRMHPVISPMIDRAAYIGGMDGFSCVAAERLVGKKASGTMPHAMIIVVGDQVKAWKYFDEVLDKEIPRIALVDTYYDEKTEAIMAAEAIQNLSGVRLDTPGSRRGDMKKIVDEVRWELDIRGYKNVKIFVSGGIDEDNLVELTNADGFGIGTSISNAKTIDFAMDIVEIEGKPVAKRGKLGGKKEIYRCPNCLKDEVIPSGSPPPVKCDSCNVEMKKMLQPLIEKGKIVRKLPSTEEIRNYVIQQLDKLEL
jgi:nicotinate phosphoribosyltransferase